MRGPSLQVTMSLRLLRDQTAGLSGELIINGRNLLRDACPAKLEHGWPSGGAHLCIEIGVTQERIQAFGEEAWSTGHKEAGFIVAYNARQPSSPRGDDGRATGQRLDCDQAKALVIGRHHRYIGCTIQERKFLLGSRP